MSASLSAETTPSTRIPLGQLRPGQTGRIVCVDGQGDFLHRLREMGLRCGAPVRMLRSGSPCILCVGPQKLCFRTCQLDGVLVDTND